MDMFYLQLLDVRRYWHNTGSTWGSH